MRLHKENIILSKNTFIKKDLLRLCASFLNTVFFTKIRIEHNEKQNIFDLLRFLYVKMQIECNEEKILYEEKPIK